MERNILERYERSDDGKLIIDVASNRIEDLFNDYDRSAPFLKKDLNEDLVEYLVDSAREVRKQPFIIRFGIESDTDELPRKRLRQSIHRYFRYLQDLEIREMNRMLRTSLILFLLGLVILTLAVWVNQQLSEESLVISQVFAEGLTIAAWVALWESLANLLLNWLPHRRQISLYQRLAVSPLLFRFL
ncbi:MAG: hypothetical protein OEX12_12780 [Gammaproteobacteria bacterium]|nr:hypothetical protein [Gammaproteobacteria bacterium]